MPDPWDDFRRSKGMSDADQWGKIYEDAKARGRQARVDLVNEKRAIHDRARLTTEARIKRSAYADKAKGFPLTRVQRVVIGEASRLDRAVSPVLDRKILPKGYKPTRKERAIVRSGGATSGPTVARAASRAAGRALGVAAVATDLAFPSRAGQGEGSERTLARRSPRLAREYADHQRRRKAGR